MSNIYSTNCTEVAVSYHLDDLAPAAKKLASQLQIALIPPLQTEKITHLAYLLIYTSNGLELYSLKHPYFKPIRVDFTHNRLQYRRQQKGGVYNEHLIRACGIKPGSSLKVIDATTGLGEDASLLATAGCQVLMIERCPLLAALLQDGLNRLQRHPTTSISRNLKLHPGDAIIKLTHLPTEQQPDIVFLDPMFEPRHKTALVKKEMRIIRELVGPDVDSSNLLQAALSCAKKRVVVKRHRLAPTLTHLSPSFTMHGRASRFDVYCILNS